MLRTGVEPGGAQVGPSDLALLWRRTMDRDMEQQFFEQVVILHIFFFKIYCNSLVNLLCIRESQSLKHVLTIWEQDALLGWFVSLHALREQYHVYSMSSYFLCLDSIEVQMFNWRVS